MLSLDADGFVLLDCSAGKSLTVSEKDYVIGAVMAEIPPSYHTQAIMAQAVAVHTYAAVLREQQRENPDASLNGADLTTDSTTHQGYVSVEQAKEMYGDNFEVYYQKISEAVEQVWNEILTYDGTPITAVFHAISPGTTESSENIWGKALPYLVPVASSWDELASGYQSEASFTEAQMKSTLSQSFTGMDFGQAAKNWFSNLEYSESGTVLSADVCGKTVTGGEIRTALNLRSAAFEVSFSGGSFTFSVKGYGHGVGLSQNGADFMARQGKTYREILSHYYPGTEIAVLS